MSTHGQTVKTQKVAVSEYLRRKRIHGVEWVTETASGCKKVESRKLGGLLDSMSEGDVLIITELSRLGRSLTMIFNALQFMIDRKIGLVAIKENFELGDNVYSKVLAFAFGLSAEIERNLISERTKMGLARARKEGKTLGWRKGRKRTPKLFGKGEYIRRELRKGRSKSSLARELAVSWPTMANFIKLKRLG